MIVDKIGHYLTRGGKIVYVFAIDKEENEAHYVFVGETYSDTTCDADTGKWYCPDEDEDDDLVQRLTTTNIKEMKQYGTI